MDKVECSVCHERYDLKEHAPKALRCIHTFCGSCVQRLVKNTKITCPTCRREGEVDDIRINYPLVEILEALCELCFEKEKDKQCRHCDKTLCVSCRQSHSMEYNASIVKKVHILQQNIKVALDLSLDESAINDEKKHEEDTIVSIKEAVNVRRNALDEIEQKLLDQVKSLKRSNIKSVMTWNMKVSDRASRARDFVQTAMIDIEEVKSEGDAIYPMELEMNIDKHLVSIQDLIDGSPQKIKYEFCKSKNTPRFCTGVIVTSTNDIQTKAENNSSRQESEEDQVSLKKDDKNIDDVKKSSGHTKLLMSASAYCPTGTYFNNMVQIYGSKIEKISEPRHVTCTPEKVFVTCKHRIVVFDHRLDILDTIGAFGYLRGASVFVYPSGITIDQNGKLYVTEEGTHRIKIIDQKGILEKVICEKHFDHPLGITISRNNELYMCNQDQQTIEILSLSGAQIRHFRTKSDPLDVAIIDDNKVIIVEHSSTKLNVYTTHGEYIESWPKTIPANMTLGRAPGGVCTDGHGHVIVPYIGGRLVVLTDKGQYVCTFPDEKWEFSGRAGVCVSPHGDVIVCDTGKNIVRMFGSKDKKELK